jgi:hypothetical protein
VTHSTTHYWRRPVGQSDVPVYYADHVNDLRADNDLLRQSLNRATDRIVSLMDKLDKLQAAMVEEQCTCLPYAEPGDGMCHRCMSLRGLT